MGIFHANCPTRDLLNLIADRWTVLVVYFLAQRPQRFNELLRKIEGISQRMLTVTLRRLEMEGLVTREVVPVSPPRVTYALTPLGESLVGLVQQIQEWAEAHADQASQARAQFMAQQQLTLEKQP